MLSSLVGMSQTTYTLNSSCTAGCNWSTNSSWVGGVAPTGSIPTNGSVIVIPQGTVVLLNGPIAISQNIIIQAYGVIDMSNSGSKITLSSGSTIQVAATGDIITTGSNSNQLRIGSGQIKGSDIDAMQSPNQITETTLNDPLNAGCAETGTCNDDPLPIELLFFRGQANANQNLIKLLWATATEENFEYFEISKSLDGKSFETIGKIGGAGNTTVRQDYSFTDNLPYKGLNYYQLKAIDYDGYTEAFDVVVVQMNEALSPVVYPNPITNHEIKISGLSAHNPFSLVLRSLNGKVVYQINGSGKNMINLPTDITSGLYLLDIQVDQQHFKQKVIIQ